MTRITDEAVEQLAELWHVPTDVRAAGKDLEREISRSTSASLEPAAKQLVSDTIRDSLAFENDMPRGHLLVQIANRAAHLLFERSVLSEAALPHLAPQPLLDPEAVRARLWEIWQNPSESPADYASEWADAVMELARPMPTREQIAKAMHDHQMEHGWRQGCREDVCIQIFHQRAAAVLELINGSAS